MESNPHNMSNLFAQLGLPSELADHGKSGITVVAGRWLPWAWGQPPGLAPIYCASSQFKISSLPSSSLTISMPEPPMKMPIFMYWRA